MLSKVIRLNSGSSIWFLKSARLLLASILGGSISLSRKKNVFFAIDCKINFRCFSAFWHVLCKGKNRAKKISIFDSGFSGMVCATRARVRGCVRLGGGGVGCRAGSGTAVAGCRARSLRAPPDAPLRHQPPSHSGRNSAFTTRR